LYNTHLNQTLALESASPNPYSSFSNPDQPRDVDGRSHFHYFQHKAILEISSLLALDFWNNYILPFSSSSQAIQYSIIALGAQHREFLGNNSSNGHKYALLAYGHAIRSLNKRLTEWGRESEKGTVVGEVLLTCLLFICFNLLRGEGENDAAALVHLEAGLKICNFHHDSLYQISGDTDQRLASHLIDTLRRLDLQTAFYLGAYQLKSAHMILTRQYSAIWNSPPAFISISEVRGHLEDILLETYYFIVPQLSP